MDLLDNKSYNKLYNMSPCQDVVDLSSQLVARQNNPQQIEASAVWAIVHTFYVNHDKSVEGTPRVWPVATMSMATEILSVLWPLMALNIEQFAIRAEEYITDY